MKKISIIVIIIGTLMICIGLAPLLLNFLPNANSTATGIIGGADGPTAIFVTSTLWLISFYGITTILGSVALIVGVILLIVSRSPKK